MTKEDLIEKAGRMADQAVGREIRVRVERATARQSGLVVAGPIVRCEVAGTRRTEAREIVRWRVWVGRRPEPVVVEALPR